MNYLNKTSTQQKEKKTLKRIRTRISTSKTKTLRLVESRHFPTFFSFVSIDPESAIMLIVPSSCNSIGFRAYKNNRKQNTFVSSSMFGTGFFFSYFKIFFRRIREKQQSLAIHHEQQKNQISH